MASFKDWIAEQLGLAGRPGSPVPAGTDVDLAVAALLVEVLRADYDVAAPERRQVVDSVGGLLGLSATESTELVTAAERLIDQSHDLYQFTSQVNRSFSETQKLQLLEQLWRVAHADATVHKYEEHLIRRIADLLHVPHKGFIAAKLRATGPLPGVE